MVRYYLDDDIGDSCVRQGEIIYLLVTTASSLVIITVMIILGHVPTSEASKEGHKSTSSRGCWNNVFGGDDDARDDNDNWLIILV